MSSTGAVPEDAHDAHARLRMPGGFSLELDTAESARVRRRGWRVIRPTSVLSSGFAADPRGSR